MGYDVPLDPPEPRREGPAGVSADPEEKEESGEGDDGSRVVTPDQSPCLDYRAIIDATEQRVERAQDNATQQKHDSGKRKCHTLQAQIVVNERGQIRHLSDSVPGSPHDLTLLRQSGVKDDLPAGLTVTADTGSRGVQNDFPDRSVAPPYRPKGSAATDAGGEVPSLLGTPEQHHPRHRGYHQRTHR